MFQRLSGYCLGFSACLALAMQLPAARSAEIASAASFLRPIAPAPEQGISQGMLVRDRPLLHTCQIFPLEAGGQVVTPSDVTVQVSQVFQNLEKLLAMGPAPRRPVAKLNVYVRNEDVALAVRKQLPKAFADQPPPAVSFVATDLPGDEAHVALDAVVVDHPGEADRVQLQSSADTFGGRTGAAAAILPRGPRIYIAGQAEKGDGTLRDATRQTLQGLLRTLEFLQLERADIVQFKAFVSPIDEIVVVEQEVASLFPGQIAPPLICVEWISSLPIEIELIAKADPLAQTPEQTVSYFTPPWMTASPVYSRVARIDHPATLFVAGLWGRPASLPAEQEIHSLFEQLNMVLKEGGSDLRHLAKATYYVTDDSSSNALNRLRPEYYDPARPPSASKAQVRAVGVPEQRLTMDMIAAPSAP